MKRSEKYALCRFMDNLNIFDDSGELLDPYSDVLYQAMRVLLKELHLDIDSLRDFYYQCGGVKHDTKQ